MSIKVLSAANKLLFDLKCEWPVSDHGLVTGQGAWGETELLLEDEGAADEVGEEEDEPAGQELGGGQHQGLGQADRDTQHTMQGLELESGGQDFGSLQCLWRGAGPGLHLEDNVSSYKFLLE